MQIKRRQILAIIMLSLAAVTLVAGVGMLLLWMAPQDAAVPVQTTYAHESSTPPNILLLIADDVGVDKITAYADDADPGYRDAAEALPQTPTIDSLAASGVRFTDAWANPKCSPTRAAVYSGRHGFRTGIGTALGPPGQDDLEPDVVTTLAELLSEEGYASSMVGKWHLGEGDVPEEWEEGEAWSDHLETPTSHTLSPLEHGWDHFAGTLTGELDTDGEGSYSDWLRVKTIGAKVIATQETTYATEKAVIDGLAWVSRQGGPWMLTMAFHAPHTPLEAPDSDCTISEGEPSTDAEIYRAMLECLDLNIADMLDGLKEQGELDDTLIFFIGDNGTDASVAEDVFDDDRGKGTLYESGVRVPLIVVDGRTWMAQQDDFVPSPDWLRSPAIIADPGSEVADLVHVIDIYATIADATGADGSDGIDSVSLMPYLRDIDGDIRDLLFAEVFTPSSATGEVAVRVEDWKLLVKVVDGDDGPCRGNYRLYDLSTDRFEGSNLNSSRSDVLETMTGWLDSVGDGDAWFDVDDCG